MINVRDFGAIGNGTADDTDALQKALNLGGHITVPAGTYLTGTLYLQSNTCLELEAGAVLLGTTDKSRYNADGFCPQNCVFTVEHVTGAHLLVAVGQKNITLCGDGVIDGNSHYWVNEHKRMGENSITFAPNDERPGQMIFFCECQNVSLRDLTLQNGPYWHLLLHGCTDVSVRGLKIYGEPLQYTNDGIDLDCCRNVTVSDCIIRTGDDGITIRAYGVPLVTPQDCENIVITNCVISSFGDYGVRIGVGNRDIRHCLLSNLLIHDSHSGIGIISRFSPKSPGVNIEDIAVSDCKVDANRALVIRMSNSDTHPAFPEPRHISDIRISGLRGRFRQNAEILGHEGAELSDIKLNDCRFTAYGIAHTPDCDERGIWGCCCTDSAMEIRDANRVILQDVGFDWEENIGFHHDIHIQNSKVSVRGGEFPKGIAEE